MQTQILLNGIEVADFKNFIKEAVQEAKANQPEQTKKPIYYSRKELAELLGVHVNTIDNLRRSGKLKFGRVGRVLRITQKEVQRLLDNQKNTI